MMDIQYRQIIETAPFGYAYHEILLDDSGKPIDYRFLEVNAAFENLTGLKAADIVGKTVLEVLPGTGTAEFDWISFYGSVALTGGNETFEQFSAVLDRWYQVQAYSQDRGFFSTVFIDSTRSKEIEKELQESEARFKLAIDGTREGIWDWDLDTGTLFMAKRWKQMLGYEDHELANTIDTFYSLISEEDAGWFDVCTQRYLHGEISKYAFEFRMKHKDGNLRWILTKGEALRDADGKPYRMAGSHSDITERKLIEASLAESALKFSKLFDNNPALMAVSTLAEGRITEVNKTFLAKTGYSNQECMGRTTGELKLFTNRHQLDQLKEELGRTGRALSQELQMTTKTGDVLDGLFSGEIIESHGARYLLMVMVDITEQKRAEQRALAASKAKSEFLATMSHEIRTPMNGIIGMTGLLLDTELTVEQRQLARIVRTSGDALLTLINDILDFSKIEAGKLTLDAMDFNLRVTIEDTVDILSMKAREKGIKLESSIDPGVPVHLRGDPGRLRQILINLAGNAVKFTGSGGVAIRTRLVSEDATTACLRFSIIDSGIGIPRDKQEALFAPFTQADSSTTRKYGGTGLGLAISKQLAEAMGGTIGLESEPGAGSTFWFTATFEKRSAGEPPATVLAGPGGPGYLNSPIRRAQAAMRGQREEKLAKADPGPNRAAPDPRNETLRILLAEDNRMNQLVSLKILLQLGYRADAVANGSLALEAMRNVHYDLVLMDCQMPELDGFEATRELRSREAGGERTPVIAMTADTLQGDRDRCLEAGMDDFLSKPVEPARLSALLDFWLRGDAPGFVEQEAKTGGAGS